MGLGADVTFYSKPAALDPAYGDRPVSFQIFLRMRPENPRNITTTKSQGSVYFEGFRRKIRSTPPAIRARISLSCKTL